MAVSRRLRFEVLRRDGHTCRYCGAKAPDVVLTVDHVTPVALGGGDEATNLVTACQPCNGGKTSIAPGSPLVDDVEADAIKWARAIETAAEYRKADRAVIDELVDQFDRIWCAWRTNHGDGDTLYRDAGWEDSIERFIAQGLTLDEMKRLVRKAMTVSTVKADQEWRYFCGCAWRTISELQDSAHSIIQADEDYTRWEAERRGAN